MPVRTIRVRLRPASALQAAGAAAPGYLVRCIYASALAATLPSAPAAAHQDSANGENTCFIPVRERQARRLHHIYPIVLKE